MKKSLFIAALFAAALAVSCQQEENVVDKPHDYITVTLQLPGNETKLGIDVVEEGEKKVGKVKWEAGDKINIHGNLISEAKIVELKAEDISADGYSATITFDKAGMTEKSPHGYYAEYPAEAVGYFLSSSEASYNSEFIDTNKPLMSAYLDGTTFIFRNLCGVISFTITDNSYDSYVFSGNNDEIVGYQQFAIKRTATDTYTRKSTGDLTSISGDVIADGVTQNFICIPIANWDPTEFTQGFSIKFKKGDKIVKEAKTNNSVNIDRNTYLPLGDITDVLVDYVKPTHHTSITEAVDLGATETANCYVITKAGSYMIPCVMGNSSESAGVRAKSKLLWETYCTDEEVTKNSVIAAVDYDDDNNYVYFKTPETLKPGNALIAAVDSEDNIIWSWHIWIPATALDEVGSYAVSAHYLMDRNLGALRATVAGSSVIDVTSNGLFYQWGRKDPFVGPGKIDEGQYLEEGKISGTARTTGKVQISLAESIKQPTFFARGLYSGETLVNPDWCSDQNGEYWGDSGSKSIYDPCPAGYRVPKRDASKLLWADTMTGYEYNSSYYWFKVGDPSVVFPALGWIDGGTSKSTCRFGIWNSHHDSWGPTDSTDPKYGYNSYAAYARRFYIESSSPKLKNSSVNKSLGYNVRCESISNVVPEPSAPAVDITSATDLSASGSANCYVVYANDATNAGKVFKFKAVKGNSNESVGEVASASIVWETYNNDQTVDEYTVIAAVGFDDQYIGFQMPSTLHAGNALIAAKNASNEILWSWHIWVPSTTIDPVTVSGIGVAKLMDRNLGALQKVSTTDGANVYTLGMFYQWGRKDPFLGPKRVENGAGYALVSGTTPSVLKGSTMTIDESVKNPTQFASDGISDMDLTKWGSTKTIYDPCPQGYKVPYVNRSSSNPITNSDIPTAMSAAEMVWESSTTGYWFKLGDGTNELVFPLAGYVEEGITSYYSYKNTIRGAVWFLCDSSSSPYHLNIRPSEGTNAFGSTNLIRGCNVRCCVDE